jgi:hypothetical protein
MQALKLVLEHEDLRNDEEILSKVMQMMSVMVCFIRGFPSTMVIAH